MPPSLPSRFSEQAFRRYEATIESVVTNWPKCTILDPAGSVETLSCRLRDAINSYHKHHWPSTIDHAKFLELYPLFVVSLTAIEGKVVVGPKEKLKTPTLSEATPPAALSFNVTDPPEPLLRALLEIHNNHLVQTPSRVVTTYDVETLATGLDVFVQNEGNNTYLIF
jgi:hypothetical protein